MSKNFNDILSGLSLRRRTRIKKISKKLERLVNMGVIDMIIEPNKAKQLRDKYEADLTILQNRCKHKKVSDWMEYHWAPGHAANYKVKCCLDCDKIVEKSAKCWGCKQPLTEKEIDNNGQYCTNCTKKNMSLLTR